MGNVQQTYSASPFIFRPCDVPSRPFAAEKRTISRRRVQTEDPRSRTEECPMEEHLSTTSSLPRIAGDSIRMRSWSPNYKAILQQLIELQDWQRVLCRIKLYPNEVNQFFPIFVDTLKNGPVRPMNNSSKPLKESRKASNPSVIFVTPLHLVCALNPPLLVVSTILRLGGPETASMPLRPKPSRSKSTLKKQLFSRYRNHLIRSSESKSRKHHNQKSDDLSQISDSIPSIQSSSSESVPWNQKINFRYSFEDYRRRVKSAMKHRRGRGGAFPIVEELNEDSGDENNSESHYSIVNGRDAHPSLETQPSSMITGKIATASTSDCSQSHQSSVSATPPRSSVSDHSVILQLSSSGSVCPMSLQKMQTLKTPEKSFKAGINILGEPYKNEAPNQLARELFPKCNPFQSDDCNHNSLFFRVQWDLQPLLRHVLDKGSLLPLHVAVLYSASSDIIKALIDAYPLATLRDVLGMLPIHFVAAGWILPPLLPPPASAILQTIDKSHVVDMVDDISDNFGILQNLTVLQHAVPESVRIRSGNNGMRPEEYVNECMMESSYKEACLRVLNQGCNISPSKEESRLFDIDMSITSSSGDIFDFNDTMNGSVDYSIEINPDNGIQSFTKIDIDPPPDYLSSLMAAQDWYSIIVAVESYPSLSTQWIFGIDEASASIYKRLPLHCACVYGGPIKLIELLISSYPEGIETIDPTDLSTPLSLACFASSSIGVIRLLLRAYPQAIDIVNIYGQAPLHVAILSKASFDIIEVLVDERPHLVLLKDNDGRSPISYAKIVYGEKNTVYQLLLMIKDTLMTKKFHC